MVRRRTKKSKAKKSEFAASREFVRGVATRVDMVSIISKGKALLERAIAHSSLVAVDRGEWASAVNTAWDSTALALALKPTRKMLLIGEDGDVVAYLGDGKSAKEKLSPRPRAIRRAATIDGYVFACGMNRDVYKRVGEAKWVDISAPKPKSKETTGFEAIDGYSEREVYAVGWGGEIWRFDGKKWSRAESPSKNILTCVCCAPTSVVYVAGQQGTLIEGRNQTWKAIRLRALSKDIWDLCWYRNRLHIATATGLFTLEGSKCAPVNVGADGPRTFNSLTTAEGLLWSIGRDDVASFDGKRWTTYR